MQWVDVNWIGAFVGLENCALLVICCCYWWCFQFPYAWVLFFIFPCNKVESLFSYVFVCWVIKCLSEVRSNKILEKGVRRCKMAIERRYIDFNQNVYVLIIEGLAILMEAYWKSNFHSVALVFETGRNGSNATKQSQPIGHHRHQTVRNIMLLVIV